jgi:dTMP kinase
MLQRQKFLAIEGIDGAGKRTQMDLLCRLLEERGVAYAQISFPRYESFFGQMVARYLNGEFGSLEAVDPHFSALLYAGDRLEAKGELERELGTSTVVLADRYIGSNLAHQTARVALEQREKFLAWLKQLEYEIYGLPKEDLVVYLRLPATEAQRLVGQKAAREYTKLQRDLQEGNLAHLEQAAQVYDRLAQEPNWVTVECFDPAAGKLRAPEEIHRDVVAAVESRAAFLVRP